MSMFPRHGEYLLLICWSTTYSTPLERLLHWRVVPNARLLVVVEMKMPERDLSQEKPINEMSSAGCGDICAGHRNESELP
jgi:hypothetical protein